MCVGECVLCNGSGINCTLVSMTCVIVMPSLLWFVESLCLTSSGTVCHCTSECVRVCVVRVRVRVCVVLVCVTV